MFCQCVCVKSFCKKIIKSLKLPHLYYYWVKNVNIVMLTNITSTSIDKAHNIYAASAYMIFVIICLWIIYVTKKIWIFYEQEHVFIYLK